MHCAGWPFSCYSWPSGSVGMIPISSVHIFIFQKVEENIMIVWSCMP